MTASSRPRPNGLDSPITGKIIKYMAKAQVASFRATNGRIGKYWRIGAGWHKPVPTLLLDHVGRKSGRTFTTPLLYLEDGRNLVIVASQGGLTTRSGTPTSSPTRGPRCGSPVKACVTSGRAKPLVRSALPCGPGSWSSTPTSRTTSRGPSARSPSWCSNRARAPTDRGTFPRRRSRQDQWPSHPGTSGPGPHDLLARGSTHQL
jgi:hypothetical protein